MVMGPYSKPIPAGQKPTPAPGTLGKLAPNVPGGPGITFPAGMVMGPYSKPIPASQRPTPLPVRSNSTSNPTVPGGPGIVFPPGMVLGPYSKPVPANHTMPGK
jgi:hypothetical protein